MASTPLFQTNLELRAANRLSQVPPDSDVMVVFDRAVEYAGLEFARRLGEARVAAIQAFPIEDPVATANGRLRVLGRLTEEILVRTRLLRTLPSGWKDASGAFLQEANLTPSFRNGTPSEVAQEISRLELEAETNFALLAGTQEAGSEVKVQADALGSDVDVAYRVVGNSPYLNPCVGAIPS